MDLAPKYAPIYERADSLEYPAAAASRSNTPTMLQVSFATSGDEEIE
jgi:hypothetical protein